jgi:hypothetical protein
VASSVAAGGNPASERSGTPRRDLLVDPAPCHHSTAEVRNPPRDATLIHVKDRLARGSQNQPPPARPFGALSLDRPPSPLASGTAAPTGVSPSPQDAYPPAQVALLVEQVGVKKATLPAVPTVALGLLAGAFIASGAMFSTLVMTDNPLGLGPGRLLGGLASPSG